MKRQVPLPLLFSFLCFLYGCGAALTGASLLFFQKNSSSPAINQPPSVLIVSPAQNQEVNDLVLIEYQLFDPEGNLSNLTVEWSTDQTNWYLASPFLEDPVSFERSDPLVGAAPLTPGSSTTYQFVWNSYKDALGLDADIYLRITPVDTSTGVTGSSATIPLKLRNTYSTTIAGRIRPQNTQLPYQPYHLLADSDTNTLYISNKKTFSILELLPQSTTPKAIVGTGLSAFNGDNLLGLQTNINDPRQMCLGWDPTTFETAILFCDSFNHRVRIYNLVSGYVTTLAGSGVPGYEEVVTSGYVDPKTLKMDTPRGIRPVWRGSTVFGVVVTEAGRTPVVRFINTSTQQMVFCTGVTYENTTTSLEIRIQAGSMRTICGNGFSPQSPQDGWVWVDRSPPANTAFLKRPVSAQIVWSTETSPPTPLLFMADGNRLRVANLGWTTVHVFPQISVSSTVFSTEVGPAKVKTILGTPGLPSLPPSSGVLAPRVILPQQISDMIVTANESDSFSIIFSEVGGKKIWYVDGKTGELQLLAGGGTSVKDGVPATDTALDLPWGLAIMKPGILFIAEHASSRIRAVNLTSSPQNVFGTTIQPNYIETILPGPQLTDIHNLLEPEEVIVDPNLRDFYVVDRMTNRVIQFNIHLRSGQVIAGSGIYGSSGDGSFATQAAIGYPEGIALLSTPSAKILLIGDNGELSNGKVRIVNLGATPVTFGHVTNLAPGHIQTLVGGGSTVAQDILNVSPTQVQLGTVLDVFFDSPPSGPPAVYISDEISFGGNTYNRLLVYNPDPANNLTYVFSGGVRTVAPGTVALLVTNDTSISTLPLRTNLFTTPGFIQALGSGRQGDFRIIFPSLTREQVFVFNLSGNSYTILQQTLSPTSFLDLTPLTLRLSDPHSIFYIPYNASQNQEEILGICDTGNHRIVFTFGQGSPYAGQTIVAIGNGQAGYNGDVLPRTYTTLSKPVFLAAIPFSNRGVTLILISEEGTGRIRGFNLSNK